MYHTELLQWLHNRWASSVKSEAGRPIPLTSTHRYHPGLITHTAVCEPHYPDLHNIPRYHCAAISLVPFDPEGEGTMVPHYTCTLRQSMTSQMTLHLKRKQILLAQ